MARQARRVSSTGYYHIMMRGNNKERIFEKESDKRNLIKSLKKAKERDSIKIVLCGEDIKSVFAAVPKADICREIKER